MPENASHPAFDTFFAQALGGEGCRPYGYQRRLATAPWPDVLVAPTGLGKTAAVVLGWCWRRITARDDTPRRLVYCLPMRALVEQTAQAARLWLENASALAPPGALPDPEHGVAVLMGGGERERTPPSWVRHPERPALIVGTQDMLLSRALMRGYGMSRFRWPVDFALLHADAQWVFDEVQAMGAGLPTSAQLQGLRGRLGTAAGTRSLWMSATLDPGQVRTVDHPGPVRALAVPSDVEEDAAAPAVRRLVHAMKRVVRAAAAPSGPGRKEIAAYAAALAEEVLAAHRPGRATLVVLNTVPRAQAVHAALSSRLGDAAAERLVLVHSRFRPPERAAATARLPKPGETADRIIVATQAVEAGVDLTASVLFTELAPWPSLVQRFGRVNRYGECGGEGAEIRWIDLPGSTGSDSKGELAPPYRPEELAAARARLAGLADAAPAALPPGGAPPALHQVLRRKDLLDLFDTDPDLTGFDIDVSPFVRDAADTDFQVLWRDLAALPAAEQPLPEPGELCAVPIGRARDLLTRSRPGWRLDPQARAGERWVRLKDNRPWPGLVVMLDAAAGGYRPDAGLLPDSTAPVPVLAPAADDAAESAADERDSHGTTPIPLTPHLARVAAQAAALCDALEVPADARAAVVAAARWHDVGKAHPEFQARLLRPPALEGVPLAKAGDVDAAAGRPYLRHELASALAWLAQHDGEPDADLIAYLVAAHHGKVRLSLRALPAEPAPPDSRRFARGVWEDDELPAVELGDGTASAARTLRLDLMALGDGSQGASWSARTARLLEHHGPFRLAWLEALVRIADWRASDAEQEEAKGDG